MDGTLLDDSGNLPAGFDDIIDELKKRDVIFAPASGRQYFSLLKLFDKYKDDFLFVAENGTLVKYQGEEIFSNPMDLNKSLEILKVGEGLNDVLSVFCGKKDAYILETQNQPEYLEELGKYFTRNTCVKRFTDVDDVPVKMSFFDKTGKAAENIYPHFVKFKSEFQVVLASDYWTDLTSLGANKGHAVQNIQKAMNISPDECAAFGDYMNDVQMLQSVTYSFAMANAHPDLKSFAKYETVSNNEYGVLVGIKRLIDEGLI